ncbi:hypothetical protein D3C78_445630 [compost metagenome]
MNKYATPEQVAEARALAQQLYAVRDAAQKLAQRKGKFGEDPEAVILGNRPDPLSGGAFDEGTARYEAEAAAEAKRYADQQARLIEAKELELVTKQQYQTLEEQMYAEHMARMQQIEKVRQEAQLESWSSGFGQMSQDLFAFADTFAQENSAMFKVAQQAAIAQTIIQTYQSAQAAFAAMASIPIVGPGLGAAAATAAVAGGLARVAAIRSQGAPGRLYGGPVQASQMYRVNENGAPEVFNAANGRQYMIPNGRGEVVSNADAAGRGGAETGGYAPAPVYQTINVTGVVDNRTATQMARAAAQRQLTTRARLGI